MAWGTIKEFVSNGNRHTAVLQVTDGKIHEGEFISSDKFVGSITKIKSVLDSKEKKISVEIEGNAEALTSSTFNVYSTLRIANIQLLIELTFNFLILFLILQALPFWRKLAIAALMTSIIFWIYRNIYLDQIHSYGGFYNGGTTILIILFALAFFYHQLKRPENPFIYSTPAFWIVSAILLYKAGTLFLFLYTNTLDQNEKENFYTINSAFYILQNFLFAIAFIVQEKQPAKNYSKLSSRTT